jgi:hypothetical protein
MYRSLRVNVRSGAARVVCIAKVATVAAAGTSIAGVEEKKKGVVGTFVTSSM